MVPGSRLARESLSHLFPGAGDSTSLKDRVRVDVKKLEKNS